jgi:glycosyltransferase involved in cell wall biosynthesis
MTKISIGILAHNESSSIDRTLKSLFQQSLFDGTDAQNSIEIVVVPNGCTDDTAARSRTILTELTQHSPHPHLRSSVCEVAAAGKSNAWNLYVHQFADPSAEYLFLMDADIQLLEIHTLRQTIETLVHHPTAQIAVDTPIKDLVFKQHKSPLEQLSVAVSSSALNDDDIWICGQFYCGRASVLRQIWMPSGLIVEDGFLTMMIRTGNFTSLPLLDRIVRTPNASHSFEALSDPRQLLRHEKRIVIGMTVNHYLADYLKENCNDQIDAGAFIQKMNEVEPLWFEHLFQNIILQTGWWLIPMPWLFRRFEGMHSRPWPKAIIRFTMAVIALLVDSIVFFQANRDMHRGNNIGYW